MEMKQWWFDQNVTKISLISNNLKRATHQVQLSNLDQLFSIQCDLLHVNGHREYRVGSTGKVKAADVKTQPHQELPELYFL